MNQKKIILGIMSGTSLDGLDFALCEFEKSDNNYNYSVIKTGFYEYDKIWKQKLATAQNISAYDFIKLHKEYGKFIGQKANEFILNTQQPDFIASHGHTIFHKPEEGVTFQLGDGAFIAAETGISTISDFRNSDTALGGQGAPLVPIGDKLLFPEYDYCLNLGGFANVSFDEENKRAAYDICPFNFIINHFANLKGKEFDKNGEIAEQGDINTELLKELNSIEYYNKNLPKSLGREYAEKYYFPIFNQYNVSVEDSLRTFYEHTAFQINKSVSNKNNAKILITGGGAYNNFFISLLHNFPQRHWIIPDNRTIDFKEAIIFAFLGFLRSIREINTLANVTGADKDTIGGNIFIVQSKN